MLRSKAILAAAIAATGLGLSLPQPVAAAEYKFLLMGALVHPYYGPMPGGIAAAAKDFGISPVPEFTMPQKFDVVEQNGYVIRLAGWAVANAAYERAGIRIFLDSDFVYHGVAELDRPDVQSANPAYGPTNAIRYPGDYHDDNSITFPWNAPAFNGRAITRYEVAGDKSETFAASRESTTIGGLGFDTTRTIRVRAFATDAGWGPWTSITGTTNTAPKPSVDRVYQGAQCGATSGCRMDNGLQCGTNCNFVAYTLSNFSGPISCAIDSSDGGWPDPDDGGGWRIEPQNGSNQSTKFFGFPGGWVSVTCTGQGVDGRTYSPRGTLNPWG